MYPIFEEDAITFVRQEEKEMQKLEKQNSGISVVDDWYNDIYKEKLL